jgi:hypothetical protein
MNQRPNERARPVDLYGMQRKMSAITLTQIGRYVATGAWMTYLRT